MNVPPASELLGKPEELSSAELQYLQRPASYNEVLLDIAELKRRLKFHPSSPSTTFAAKSSIIDAGTISKLPAEGLIAILRHTTISNLFTLRSINSTIKSVIDHWEPFKLITTYGDTTVKALLVTGAGHLWTAPQLVSVLFTTKCEFCSEHGEIIQLLKLKRCCFHCLSEERGLLAVDIEYAKKSLGLSEEEVQTLPMLTTFPQKNLWGFSSVPFTVLDYEAALRLSGDRALKCPPNTARLGMFPFKIKKTGIYLDEVFRSTHTRVEKRLHERRGKSSMKLASAIIKCPETNYWQHACAVRQRAMTRKRARLADDTLKDNVTIVGAIHCERCARYWNYHSPLPFYYHKMYPHRPTGGPTEFTNHVKHCIYAHAHWIMLECPWDPLSPSNRLILLERHRHITFSRIPGETLEQSCANFERIPTGLRQLGVLYSSDFRNFQQPYDWPQAGEGEVVEGEKAVTLRRVMERGKQAAWMHHQDDDRDRYWDMLVAPEAASQKNWACANLYNGSSTLFRGPTALHESKRLRLNRKGGNSPADDWTKAQWGLDKL
ncbi:hypothetical protein LTR84_003103 [Exophiala bonariae]|uniref:F-box domain-containing protein n=1 Tax=Exophiala bonariae TaxID=1690606 RepID=A0AAV9N916_9EURO|nr:hypothetical protein LTR84_003103 [Exophiala bonariae]